LSKIKILLTCEYYYPNLGGVQNHIRMIANYLPKKKFEVEIATSYDPNRKNKYIDGIKINSFKIAGNLAKGYSGESREYQDFLLRGKFDVIFFYAAQQWSFDLVLPIIDKIKSKKIFAPCGFSKLFHFFYIVYFFLLKLKINQFDKIICFSGHYQDYKFISKIYKKPIVIISNAGVKCKIKIYQRPKNKKILKILNVAKMSFMKNQLLLLLAVFFSKRMIEINFIFNNKNLYFRLIFVLSSLLTSFTKKRMIVNFHYNLSKEQISEAYLRNDLFLFTSLVECSPLVIYDAAINSLPFISSRVGNVEEIVKKAQNGLIYNNFFHLVKLINIFKVKQRKPQKYNFEWGIQLKKYEKEFLSTFQNN
jgi:L-malate glycosyltransferase